MNFDVVIIGGGLAGLTCGIALQTQGKQCVIINNGQAAIDFPLDRSIYWGSYQVGVKSNILSKTIQHFINKQHSILMP